MTVGIGFDLNLISASVSSISFITVDEVTPNAAATSAALGNDRPLLGSLATRLP